METKERRPSIIDRIKSLKSSTRYFLLGIVAAVICIAAVLLIVCSGSGRTTVDIDIAIKEIVEISQLHTAEYTYNSVAEVKDQENIKYYAAYEGSVIAGFDFADIKVNEVGKKIQIIVPEITILSVKVENDIDFIFVKNKYNKETVFAEAVNACKEDLFQKASANTLLFETAKESAEYTLEALLKPFERQLSEDVSFEIVFETELGGN